MLMTVKTRHQPDFQTELTNAYPQDIEFFEEKGLRLEMHVRTNTVTYVALLSEDEEPLSVSVQAEEGVSLHETMSNLREQCSVMMGVTND